LSDFRLRPAVTADGWRVAGFVKLLSYNSEKLQT
jgi:hypothetical protein